MSTLKKTLTVIAKVAKSRIFAMVALTLVCAVAVANVSVNTKKITVIDGDKTVTILTMNSDTDKVLEKVGIEVEADDKVEVTDLSASQGQIEVKRAINVTVQADGEKETIIVHDSTDVSDILKLANVTLNENDVSNLSMTTQITDGMEISIDRVEYREIVTKEEIPYEKVEKESNTVYVGKTKIYQYGMNGEKTIVTQEKLVNGEVVETAIVSEEITKEKLDKITLIGTKEIPVVVQPPKPTTTTKPTTTKPSTVTPSTGNTGATTVVSSAVSVINSSGTITDSSGKTVTYSKMLKGSGTAYYAPAGAITSTGQLARVGVVAVNPKLIPYGSKLYVASPDGKFVYGYAIAGDTGGALMSNSAVVDCYYPTYNECVNFGRRTMCVYIID